MFHMVNSISHWLFWWTVRSATFNTARIIGLPPGTEQGLFVLFPELRARLIQHAGLDPLRARVLLREEDVPRLRVDGHLTKERELEMRPS